MKILFTGGGSWGHISPIVSVYPYLKKDDKFTEFYWIGSADFEKKAAEDLGITYMYMRTAKVRRYMSWKNVTDIFVLCASLFSTFKILRKIKPEVIFSSGGYVSVPVVLMGKLLHIKIVMHEQTVSLGLANKVGTMVADKILLSSDMSLPFIKSKLYSKVVVIGNPIREELFKPAELVKYFNFKDSEKKLLYITGGSQGCKIINDVIFELLPKLGEHFNIIHQCGKSDYEKGKEFTAKFSDFYIAKEFIGEEIAAIYQHANIVVTRAGANTVNELAAFDIPSIFVPLEPCNNDEQRKNAENFVKSHKGVIIKQDMLNEDFLLETVQNLQNETMVKRVIPNNNPAALEIVKQIYLLI
ncbi:MAG: UDP-N-acetylglucosamine--N-acetylmuramyl-(pentapeptide) pyrophosphoryl-undecaprenol N-acetylglucosamine transferase [Patescibacteria group bacterium]